MTRVVHDAVTHLVCKIETLTVVFQHVHHAQRLLAMTETALIRHLSGKSALARMTERGMPKIVTESDGLGEILVQSQRPRYPARYLADFQRVRQPRAIMIAFGCEKDLRFVFETTEGFGVDYAIAVTLKIRTQFTRRDGMQTTFGIGRLACVRRQIFRFEIVYYLLEIHSFPVIGIRRVNHSIIPLRFYHICVAKVKPLAAARSIIYRARVAIRALFMLNANGA